LPGGHLTTNEQPEALGALIANFEEGFQRCSSRNSKSTSRAPINTGPNAGA
jgi:hypothetical protein